MGRTTKRGRGGYAASHRAAAAGGQPGRGGGCFQQQAAAAAAAAGSRQPDAPPAPAADSDDDDEAAEFRREAAELLKQRQQRAALPGGLTQKDLDSAIRAFTGQTGVSKNQAEDALLSTAEEHCKDFEEWLNQAFLWLAIQSEVQDEAAKLKEAMEVSLREQEAARLAEQSGPPLANLSEERLRKKFPGSAMLARLGAVLPASVLFSDRLPLREKVKNKLVEFLRLESDCNKWWPGQGTQQYFKETAERFSIQLQQAVSSSSRGSMTGALPAAAGAAAIDPAAAGTAATDPLQQSLGAAAAGPSYAKPADPSCSSPADPATAATDGKGPTPAAAADGKGPAPADGPAPAAPAAAPAAVGCAPLPDATGSCRPSPEAEGQSEPGSSAAADSCTAEEEGGAVGQRASKRKRQLPARYRSVSPSASADSCGRRKRQQRTPTPEVGQPAKRQASLDCHAAAAKDSSSAWRSASHSPGPLDPPAGQTAAAAAAAGSLGCQDSMQQQDRGVPAPLPAQQPGSKLPPLPPQQQLPPAAAAQAAAAPAAACKDGCGDPLEAFLPATDCLSQLFDGELQLLRHHVYTMPDKAGALPTIFQSAQDQLQEPDGEDSDVELVDVKQPAGGQDIPQSPELPAPPLSPPAPAAAAPAAPAAPAGPTPVGAAAAAAVATDTPDPWRAACEAAAAASAAAAAAAAQGALRGGAAAAAAAPPPPPPPPPAPAPAMPAAGLYMSGLMGSGAAAHAGAMGGFGQAFGQVQPIEQFDYRTTTNEQGTLVIEID